MGPFKVVAISGTNTTSNSRHGRVASNRISGTHATVRLVMPQQYILARAIAAALAISELPVCKLAYMGYLYCSGALDVE
jgi:hypothetical protein